MTTSARNPDRGALPFDPPAGAEPEPEPEPEPGGGGGGARRRAVLGVLTAAAVGLSATAVAQGWSLPARAAVLGGFCVALWLSEAVPLWLPTLVVWIATPLLLGGFGAEFAPWRVLGWSADPVLALFFGGFALAV
ncbi:MAG TPA: hypothetical protein VFR81_05635, partial [Longimicrobium sp.]|nr:hypothetical protein [Longimicrobium sp.]